MKNRQLRISANSPEELCEMFGLDYTEVSNEIAKGAYTNAEKGQLKELICKMIDNGEAYGHLDTAEMVGEVPNIKVHRKVWEVSIRKVIDIEP
jgi:hypothetical protein